MPIVVLIGGGNASGKKTISRSIKKDLLALKSALTIDEIDLEFSKYCNKHKPPYEATNYNFVLLIDDLDKSSSDVVIVNGIFALFDKTLRSKSSIKIYIECDNDTRLTRYIKREILTPNLANPNSVNQNEKLTEIIENHLNSRDQIFGKVESDIIIKSGVSDDDSEKVGVELIVDYLRDLIKGGVPSSGFEEKINLRDTFERFYELN